ncbi:hypothetical protein Pcinc_003650 [Petrolisthes cinctipes]|uniref:Uncharacterized protein n=1 Tax=Petrolisthes cinctipes TaxID=88211 RepID=A0AAE1L2A0_PETCI|nr:hypothetical protein Pcinc_003650 [Petrolisthes cinctipes]
MASEPSSEQSASPSPASSREGRHTYSGLRRVSSLHCVLRESPPVSVSPAFSRFMDESVSVPELLNCLQQRVDATLVKSSIQQPGTMSSPRAAREQVTVAEIHDIPHSLCLQSKLIVHQLSRKPLIMCLQTLFTFLCQETTFLLSLLQAQMKRTVHGFHHTGLLLRRGFLRAFQHSQVQPRCGFQWRLLFYKKSWGRTGSPTFSSGSRRLSFLSSPSLKLLQKRSPKLRRN